MTNQRPLRDAKALLVQPAILSKDEVCAFAARIVEFLEASDHNLAFSALALSGADLGSLGLADRDRALKYVISARSSRALACELRRFANMLDQAAKRCEVVVAVRPDRGEIEREAAKTG